MIYLVKGLSEKNPEYPEKSGSALPVFKKIKKMQRILLKTLDKLLILVYNVIMNR